MLTLEIPVYLFWLWMGLLALEVFFGSLNLFYKIKIKRLEERSNQKYDETLSKLNELEGK